MKIKIIFLFTVLSAACISSSAQQQKSQSPLSVKVLVDSIDQVLFKNYIFPEKSKLIGAFLRSQLKKGVYKNIKDPKELAEKISHDIQLAHKDPHMNVNYDPGFAAVLLNPPSAPKPGDDSLWISNAKQDNFAFKKVEILNGNIGYVKFDGFNGFIEHAKAIASSAFRFVSNTNAVIIDLRNNGGGSPWMVKQIASYFVNERTRLNDIYERKADKTFEFWAEPGLGENMKLSMPLYILTGKSTGSAAEDFTYAMKVNKRAIVVGDTTWGGAHPTGPIAVGQGFVISVPFARSINHITKTDWEGTGVFPDVPVRADEALTVAQKMILAEAITNAKSDDAKRKYTWALNALRVHEYDTSINTEQLLKFTGSFGSNSISVSDNALHFQNAWGKVRLTPISDNLYSGGDWIHVEFISETNGEISSLKLLNRNGGEELVLRNK